MDKRTEEILNKIYNLILDTEIHKNERDILLRYKTLLENTKMSRELSWSWQKLFVSRLLVGFIVTN